MSPALQQQMQAWAGDTDQRRIALVERPVPAATRGELLVRVLAAGVCRTDLHVLDGDLPVHRHGVVPGHQVVGRVEALGEGESEGVGATAIGDLVGIAWLRHTCGVCAWCRSGRENLCPESQYTGWDADGGYAEFATVPEAFAYPLPPGTDPRATAPLLCAGIIGYRALSRAALPPGGILGIYGFGSSASITAQLAIAGGATVFAMSRGSRNRALATDLGCAFVGDATAVPPRPVDSAIVFAPAGELVPVALASTIRGGTVVLAGIHMSEIPAMDYDRLLFEERDLRSVTANTRADDAAFLRLAQTLSLTPSITDYPFSYVDAALDDLRSGAATGSIVISTG